MADTYRSFADLLVLFADNTTQDISPQDLRDFVESMKQSEGGCYISASDTTSIGSSDEWTLVAGTTTQTSLYRFTHNGANRLTYIGSPDVHCHVTATMGMTASGNSKIFEFGIAKNGSINEPSVIPRKIGNGADVGAAAVATDVTLTTGDYVELYVRNTTDSTNVTFENAYMSATGTLT
ncbi:MAG: hypothetical protein GY788_23055 [bacterium]|nr:hypothetical protein [bacterium]